MKVVVGLLCVFASAAVAREGHAQDENTATGYHALYANTFGDSNTAMGYAALRYNTAGSRNSAFGRGALYSSTGVNDNTAVGYLALYNGASSGNTAVGVNALESSTAGEWNVAVGGRAMADSVSGDYNVAIGYYALRNNGDGNLSHGYSNVAVGGDALVGNTSGNYNVALGDSALSSNATGNNNTAIGYGAGPVGSGLSNTGAFGAGAVPSFSNHIRIGNSAVTSIGGAVPWSNLSDARFKQNVKEDVPGLQFITRLRPVTFYWDQEKLNAFEGGGSTAFDDGEKGHRKYTGFLAQEVEVAAKQCDFDFSGLIKPPNEMSTYQLSYADFVVPLVKSVQEQQREIDALKTAIAGLSVSSGAPLNRAFLLGLGAGGLGAALVLWLLGMRKRREVHHVVTSGVPL